jgi:acyl-CoA synthetase (AMP-forming)/AMP-acid ligase II
VCSSAQALPKTAIKYLQEELFPHAKIFSMYGLTECKSVSCLDPNEITKRPDSVGKALPNMEVYVVDNQGRKQSYDATGELVVRGSNVMKGYLNNEEETNKKLRPGEIPGERVLYTGDLFHIDKDGFLYFLGRIDNMINTSGIQISPKEIEDVLYELEGILEAAVFAVPHHIYGEAIKAVVSVEQNSGITEETLRDHCHQHLEKVSIPHVFEITTATLPKTPTGKINKKALIK